MTNSDKLRPKFDCKLQIDRLQRRRKYHSQDSEGRVLSEKEIEELHEYSASITSLLEGKPTRPIEADARESEEYGNLRLISSSLPPLRPIPDLSTSEQMHFYEEEKNTLTPNSRIRQRVPSQFSQKDTERMGVAQEQPNRDANQEQLMKDIRVC